jgi:hypothetical protein
MCCCSPGFTGFTDPKCLSFLKKAVKSFFTAVYRLYRDGIANHLLEHTLAARVLIEDANGQGRGIVARRHARTRQGDGEGGASSFL